MSKQHPEHGQWIPLSWEDDPQFYAVRGHVPFSAAEQELRGNVESTWHMSPDAVIARTRHTYAGWRMNGAQSSDGGYRELRLCDGPGRGAFPVTAFEPEAEPRT